MSSSSSRATQSMRGHKLSSDLLVTVQSTSAVHRRVQVRLAPTDTVATLKTQLQERLEEHPPVATQRLLASGRILRDRDRLFAAFGLSTSHLDRELEVTCHLSTRRANVGAPSPTPSPLPTMSPALVWSPSSPLTPGASPLMPPMLLHRPHSTPLPHSPVVVMPASPALSHFSQRQLRSDGSEDGSPAPGSPAFSPFVVPSPMFAAPSPFHLGADGALHPGAAPVPEELNLNEAAAAAAAAAPAEPAPVEGEANAAEGEPAAAPPLQDEGEVLIPQVIERPPRTGIWRFVDLALACRIAFFVALFGYDLEREKRFWFIALGVASYVYQVGLLAFVIGKMRGNNAPAVDHNGDQVREGNAAGAGAADANNGGGDDDEFDDLVEVQNMIRAMEEREMMRRHPEAFVPLGAPTGIHSLAIHIEKFIVGFFASLLPSWRPVPYPMVRVVPVVPPQPDAAQQPPAPQDNIADLPAVPAN